MLRLSRTERGYVRSLARDLQELTGQPWDDDRVIRALVQEVQEAEARRRRYAARRWPELQGRRLIGTTG